jgi:DNA helicase II / ATP-dependent DNA helicase PcrA
MGNNKIIFSDYQKAIFNFIKTGKGNAVVNAVAGAGKTFTITNALSMIPDNQSVLFIAFNKHIKDELAAKVQKMGIKNVEVKTVHSYGASALWYNYKSRMDADKIWKAIDTMFPTWKVDKDVQKGYVGRVKKLVELAKLTLADSPEELYHIATRHDIELLNGEVTHAMEIKNMTDSNKRSHDFNDMLYFPVKHKLKTRQYDWVFIDECQDLSVCAQELMKKAIKPGGRFVAVGDPHQCIYGFAGADVESFKKLQALPNTITLPLSDTYRCSKAVTKLAQGLVPHINCLDSAPEGLVRYDGKLKELEQGHLILSRVNRPLITLCLQLLSEGQKAFVKGRDIGTNLANMLKKTNEKDFAKSMERLEFTKSKMIKKMIAHGSTSEEARDSVLIQTYNDKLGALDALGADLINTSSVIDRIYEIFADDKAGIILSSVHKAKGLEANKVFIVEPQKMPAAWVKQDWEREQELNIQYVAYTRAITELVIIPESEFTTYN